MYCRDVVSERSFNIDLVIVVAAKVLVAFGTFALSRFVSRLETLVAKDVETLGQDAVLLLNVANWTFELLLVPLDFLVQHHRQHVFG